MDLPSLEKARGRGRVEGLTTGFADCRLSGLTPVIPEVGFSKDKVRGTIRRRRDHLR
jgi:hypothetical protein